MLPIACLLLLLPAAVAARYVPGSTARGTLSVGGCCNAIYRLQRGGAKADIEAANRNAALPPQQFINCAVAATNAQCSSSRRAGNTSFRSSIGQQQQRAVAAASSTNRQEAVALGS